MPALQTDTREFKLSFADRNYMNPGYFTLAATGLKP